MSRLNGEPPASEGTGRHNVARGLIVVGAGPGGMTAAMTSHQLCRLLEIPSRGELDRFLKHHGVPLHVPGLRTRRHHERATLAEARARPRNQPQSLNDNPSNCRRGCQPA